MTLVVGVDFSEYSKVVAKVAQRLSRQLGADLVYIYAFFEPNLFQRMPTTVKKDLRDFYAEQIRKIYKTKPDNRILIKFTSADEAVVQTAREYKNSMIVIGHRGDSDLRQSFIGNTTEKVALKSPVPVWIHRGANAKIPKKFLVPCDLSSRARRAMKQIKIFSPKKSEVELYHAVPRPLSLPEFQRRAEKLDKSEEKKNNWQFKKFKGSHGNYKVTREWGDPVEKIQNRAKKFDVIVISPRNHRKPYSTFGSVTTKIIRNGDRPIFITP